MVSIDWCNKGWQIFEDDIDSEHSQTEYRILIETLVIPEHFRVIMYHRIENGYSKYGCMKIPGVTVEEFMSECAK